MLLETKKSARPSYPDYKWPKEIKAGLKDAVGRAVTQATSHLYSLQAADGHWCAELESNTTITAEYVMLHQVLISLGSERHRERMNTRRDRWMRYFFRLQKADGSWGLASNYPGDVSTTAETYLALRLLDVDVNDPRMSEAQQFILDNGGLERVRVFTRIHLALFGLFPWSAIPAIPPEVILLPARGPLSIYSLSSWARATVVPLCVVLAHEPVCALPNGKSADNPWLDHLWHNPADKQVPYCPSARETLAAPRLGGWKGLFAAAEVLMRLYRRHTWPWLRRSAIAKCEAWLVERVEQSGDIAGIFPPMANGVLALLVNGHAPDSEVVQRMLGALERFEIDDELGLRVQSCVSPVWDTILSLRGLVDAGERPDDTRLMRARHWLDEKQLFVEHGDWKVFNPRGPSGGWSFEYENSWYPDLDDTAVIVSALIKQDPSPMSHHAVTQAVDWMVSMQNRDGGWAAFDVNNDRLFLNDISFSDMDSMCDPSSPDLTGRVLEALGLFGKDRFPRAVARGITYLRRAQEPQGSWYGRWGVNYIYGTSVALCGLGEQRLPLEDPMVARAIQWLRAVQNPDGGWGECLESYKDKSLMGQGTSTPSQTAWALMGLLPYLPASDPTVQAGVRWLLDRQIRSGQEQGSWEEHEFTGTGFPNHFYLRYHLYRHYFPLMALGRFLAS